MKAKFRISWEFFVLDDVLYYHDPGRVWIFSITFHQGEGEWSCYTVCAAFQKMLHWLADFGGDINRKNVCYSLLYLQSRHWYCKREVAYDCFKSVTIFCTIQHLFSSNVLYQFLMSPTLSCPLSQYSTVLYFSWGKIVFVLCHFSVLYAA